MLDSIHTAIITRLTDDLPGVTVAAYPKIERTVSLPSVLLDMGELEPDDFGNDQFECYARFVAYCIYDPVAINAEQEVRNLAATVAVRIYQEEDFGVEVTKRAEVLRVSEDNFRPELDGYLVWAVEFQVGLTLGESEWSINPVNGVSITTITIGDLGAVHIDKQIADGQEPAADDDVILPDQPKG